MRDEIRSGFVRRDYIAGSTIEVEKLFTAKYGGKKKRASRNKPTAEDVQKYNERRSKDEFRRMINANFLPGDLHMIFTYIKAKRPPPQEAAGQLTDALKKARREYAKRGLPLKWTAVTGYGGMGPPGEEETGELDGREHKETAIHHHLVVNYIDIRIWTEIWKEHGRVWFFPLDGSGDYTELANYLFRHTAGKFRDPDAPCKKRWRNSRNLVHPKPKERVIHADSWRKDPIPPKGYVIIPDSIRVGVSEVTGYPYQFYRMRKIDPERERRPAGRKSRLRDG